MEQKRRLLRKYDCETIKEVIEKIEDLITETEENKI